MNTIQPFIDLGWYTVPLQGELRRLDDGSKTRPKFESNWKAKYQEKFNEKPTAIGGVITGSVSNIIAIDCDTQTTYDLFKSLDPSYTFHFISKGKPKGGGTIVYQYPEGQILPSFSIQDPLMALDFYSDNGFVYLPTEDNSSKEAWKQLTFKDFPELKPLPTTVLTLLQTLHHQLTKVKPRDKDDTIQIPRHNYLAPQIELFIAKKTFIPSLFRVITPKDFRDLPSYIKLGYLHPDEIPEGRGSEYLSKVSAILGADSSISQDLYVEAMYLINDLWKDPLPKDRLNATIIDPMINKKANIDGIAIWTYDEHWKSHGLAFTNKLGEAVEVFFDDIRVQYYLINYTKNTTKVFYRDTDIYSYIETVGVAPPSRKDIKPIMPIVRTAIDPSKPFGFYSPDEYTKQFNIFKQTPALAILNNPKPYKPDYKRPVHIIQFFESLVPDNVQRHYLLRFLKRKLTTFEYSPVVLYFLGKQGTGKDTFVSLLSAILGDQYIAKPTTREFLEQFNGWIVDKYFAQLDEYGSQLAKLSDKQEAIGKILAYSGKSQVQIRQMRTDGFNYEHSMTLIMTANKNPLLLDEDDRRIALCETPLALKDAQWVIEAGGVTNILSSIFEEINDFCYYLATEIDMPSRDEYMQPPMTAGKKTVIAEALSAGDKIAYFLKNTMFDELYHICEEFNYNTIFQHAPEGRIYEEDLYDLYTLMTDGAGSKQGLTKAMRDFPKIPTTKAGAKAYYYQITGLKYYTIPLGDISI